MGLWRSFHVIFLCVLSAGAPVAAGEASSLQRQAGTSSAVVLKRFAEVAVYPERDASAQAASLNESQLSAEINARIEAILVEPGQVVKRGAVLARLDCRDYELAVQRAEAALRASQAREQLAEQQLRRAGELAARNFLSADALAQRKTELDVLKADHAQNRSQLDTARRAVSKCVVTAPFPAIVKRRLAHVGELAAPGSLLIALIDISRIEVSAQVQVKDVSSLKAAPAVRFTSVAGDHAVALIRVSPAISREARTVEARLRFTDTAPPPGADGRIVWRDPRPHLPAELLVRRGAHLGVFVSRGGVARFMEIPEAQEGRPVAAALAAGALVVTQGQLTLHDGDALPAVAR